MADTELVLSPARHAQELRDMWQGRVLAETRRDPIGIVVLSILAHSFDDAMDTLLRAVFPGFRSITAPFLCSAGRIVRTGHVCADIVFEGGRIEKNYQIFRSTNDMRSKLRRLADRCRLTDQEREQFFIAARRWVVCDYRIDPTMNPADPDSRRLVAH